MAQVYKLQLDFPAALKCADSAIELFSELGDRARKSFAIDTINKRDRTKKFRVLTVISQQCALDTPQAKPALAKLG